MIKEKLFKEKSKGLSKKKMIVGASVIALLLVICIAGVKANKDLFKKTKASDEMNQEYASIVRDTSITCDNYGNLQLKRSVVEDKTENMEDSWTVLVYMSGAIGAPKDPYDKFFLHNIKNNLYVSEENMKKVNFVIEAGGTEHWDNDYVEKDKITRLKLNAQDAYDVVETLDHEDRNMGTPEELAEFIEWGTKKYPAKHTMLYFWGAGRQSMNICYDAYGGKHDGLTIGEIECALAKAKNSLNAPFDIIMFDNGYTGSIERANAVAPYANYMIASPTHDEVKDCYDYVSMFNTMLSKPEASAEELCDVLFDKTNENFFNRPCSCNKEFHDKDTLRFTVCNLRELDNLLVELNSVFKEVYSKASESKIQLWKLNKVDSKSYRYDFYEPYLSDEFIDLGDYLTTLSKKTGIDVSKCQETLKKFVYKSIGGKFAGGDDVSGIAFYHPFGEGTLYDYNIMRNYGMSPYYLKYIERTFHKLSGNDSNNFREYAWESSPCFYEDNFEFINYEEKLFGLTDFEAVNFVNKNAKYAAAGFMQNWFDNMENIKVEARKEFTEIDMNTVNGDFTAKIKTDPEYVSTVYNALFTKIGDKLAYLGEDAKVVYDETTGEIKSNFNGEWIMLADGQLVTKNIWKIDENNIINYTIPALVNGVESTIFVTEYNGRIYPNEYYYGSKLSGYSSSSQQLVSGTKIVPIYEIWNEETGTYDIEYGEEYSYKCDGDFLFTQLKDNEYQQSFLVEAGSGYRALCK